MPVRSLICPVGAFDNKPVPVGAYWCRSVPIGASNAERSQELLYLVKNYKKIFFAKGSPLYVIFLSNNFFGVRGDPFVKKIFFQKINGLLPLIHFLNFFQKDVQISPPRPIVIVKFFIPPRAKCDR